MAKSNRRKKKSDEVVEAYARVRWALSRDLKEMEEIDDRYLYQAFGQGWIKSFLKKRNIIGKVVECDYEGFDGKVLGFMVYEIKPNAYSLLKLAVLPEVRRRGIGRTLLTSLMFGLGNRRREILTLAHEEDVIARSFLRSHGFKAVGVAERPWPADSGDGHRYRFVVGGDVRRPNRMTAIRVSQ